ncbi:MAG: hypothetical protein KatS3mg102_0763 [Planctomycetota bacterium]|nr:MAG: hypothetical protein KatS3mg102_0763 [Planctomycetota bacterium]
MGFVLAAILIVLGAFAASAVVLAKKPELKQTLDRLRQYEGYLGVVGCLWGLWMTIRTLIHIGAFMRAAPLLGLTMLASSVVLTLLGFLSGFGLIQRYALASSPQARARAEQLRARLDGIRNPLGLAGMALGVWCLLVLLLF